MTLRALVVGAALAAASLLAAVSAQAEDCDPSDPFAEADAAPRVAIVRATGAPSQFRVTLVVENVLKGPTTPASMTVSFDPLAGTSMRAGGRYLVFFTPAGEIHEGCSTLDLAGAPGRALAESLRAWLAASDPRGRTALLVRLGTAAPATGPALAPQRALAHLAARPQLLAELTPPERAALVAAVPAAVDERAHSLSWILARLHATESMPAWIGFMSVNSHQSANHRPVHEALQVMTNRHDPAYQRGQDFHGPARETLRSGWASWHARHAGKPAQDVVAIGARERGALVPVLSDRASLAIAVRDGKDELTRKVALAACEQLLRTPTSLVPTSTEYHVDWAKASAVCSVPRPAPPAARTP